MKSHGNSCVRKKESLKKRFKSCPLYTLCTPRQINVLSGHYCQLVGFINLQKLLNTAPSTSKLERCVYVCVYKGGAVDLLKHTDALMRVTDPFVLSKQGVSSLVQPRAKYLTIVTGGGGCFTCIQHFVFLCSVLKKHFDLGWYW